MYFPLLVLLLVMQKQKNRTKIRNEQRAALVEQPTTLQVTSILISLSKKIASQLKSSKQSAALEATAALVKAPSGHGGSHGAQWNCFSCGSLAVCRPAVVLLN